MFPPGGVRLLAYPARHWAVGQALEAVARAHFAPLLPARPVGITLQIDEGAAVFDAKHSALHPLFAPGPWLPRGAGPAGGTGGPRAWPRRLAAPEAVSLAA